MYRNFSSNSSTDSDVFYVEQSSPERSPIRHNTPVILNSTQLSGATDPETITISSVASPEPQIVTIDSDSNEPTFPYAFGAQYPIVPPSLNDLNLPANPFNILTSMAVVQQDQEDSITIAVISSNKCSDWLLEVLVTKRLNRNKLTLGVNICSVRVPSSLVWWRH